MRVHMFIILILSLVFLAGCERAPDAGRFSAPILALGAIPDQTPHEARPITLDTPWEASAVASYRITAVVLSTHGYSEHQLPVDAALAWGPLVYYDNYSALKIWQGGRWFRWTADVLPVPEKVITESVANVHLVPASDEVREFIEDLERGDRVAMEGDLVNVFDGRVWRRTSLLREDAGAGACEIFYITAARRL